MLRGRVLLALRTAAGMVLKIEGAVRISACTCERLVGALEDGVHELEATLEHARTYAHTKNVTSDTIPERMQREGFDMGMGMGAEDRGGQEAGWFTEGDDDMIMKIQKRRTLLLTCQVYEGL